ncbi:hypothetical protein MMC16_001741 [Acarospora aff. strigata]|nr:hypothetical protein [Acarospora aff. strigata]
MHSSTAPRAQHLAILECDQPLTRTRAKYGGYGGVFTALLKAGAAALGEPDLISDGSESNTTNGGRETNGNGVEGRRLRITKWDIERNMETYPNLEEIDGILITGSRHSAFDNTPWILRLVSYVAAALAHHHVRVIGVCFGHQIVGRAMGSKVGRSEIGWETSVCGVRLSEVGKELFDGREELALHQMHRDVVSTIPSAPSNPTTEPTATVQLLGSSPRCPIQGLYIPHQLLTVQGHPEFTAEIVRELLETRHEQGIFDDKVFAEAMTRVGKEHDGVVVAKAFLRFLMD